MILVNQSSMSIVITDLQLGGVSILPVIRAQMLKSGQLEDDEDVLTLLPGESLTAAADEAQWIEGLEFL